MPFSEGDRVCYTTWSGTQLHGCRVCDLTGSARFPYEIDLPDGSWTVAHDEDLTLTTSCTECVARECAEVEA